LLYAIIEMEASSAVRQRIEKIIPNGNFVPDDATIL
jgi:hypothetical protein